MINNVALPGQSGSCRLSLEGGKISQIEPETMTEIRWLAIPGLVNLHAHCDRAFTTPAKRPLSLDEAIAISAAERSAFTVEDVFQRACRLLASSVGHGVTRIRSHTDVDPLVEMRSMEGVLRAKAAFTGRIDLDVIAFSTSMNDLLEPSGPARVREAVSMGADLIGASPNQSQNPLRSIEVLLDLADELDKPLDVHLDEHLSPDRSLTCALVDAVLARGLVGRVTLSHCSVLSALQSDDVAPLIDKIMLAGMTVVALPETNLFLQDRGPGTPRARGITLVRELMAAGVPVRFGTDNVRDWFFPFGDGDMLDTALFGALVAHVHDTNELLAGLCDGRTCLQPGDVADLVLVPADSFEDAIARRPGGRVTVKGGAVVSGDLHAQRESSAQIS